MPSTRVRDSTWTTVAPWSAKALLMIGPTPNQAKSAILTPSNVWPREPFARAAGRTGSRRCSSSAFASPSRGAGAHGPSAERDSRANGPG